MKKKVLVIGASGSLGQELMEVFSEEYSVVGNYNDHLSNGLIHLDISEKGEVDSVFEKENPGMVLLSAAKTNAKQYLEISK